MSLTHVGVILSRKLPLTMDQFFIKTLLTTKLTKLHSESVLFTRRQMSSSSDHIFQKHTRFCSSPRQTFGKQVLCSHNIMLHKSANGFSSLSTNSFICAAYARSFSSAALETQSVNSISTDLFFPDFPTIKAAECLIGFMHNITGLPWWSGIVLTAFVLRVVLPLPLSIYSMHNAVRLKKLEPEIRKIVQRLKVEVSIARRKFKWTEKKAKQVYIRNLKKNFRTLYIRDNCHPMKDSASFWVRIPIWLSASYALRNMASRAVNPDTEFHADYESLTNGGIAWFSDLAQVDSTWCLPVMMGAVTLLNVEINRSSVSETTMYRKGLTLFLRGISLAFIPISSYLPSGLVLYWISSGLFSTLQTLMVDRSNKFRALIGVPPLPSTEKKS